MPIPFVVITKVTTGPLSNPSVGPHIRECTDFVHPVLVIVFGQIS